MASETIKADYELLEQASGMFNTQAESTETMLANLISCKDNLMAESEGDWSVKFDDEMAQLVIPKITRLKEALANAAQILTNISQELQEAEDRAGNLFNQS